MTNTKAYREENYGRKKFYNIGPRIVEKLKELAKIWTPDLALEGKSNDYLATYTTSSDNDFGQWGQHSGITVASSSYYQRFKSRHLIFHIENKWFIFKKNVLLGEFQGPML